MNVESTHISRLLRINFAAACDNLFGNLFAFTQANEISILKYITFEKKYLVAKRLIVLAIIEIQARIVLL